VACSKNAFKRFASPRPTVLWKSARLLRGLTDFVRVLTWTFVNTIVRKIVRMMARCRPILLGRSGVTLALLLLAVVPVAKGELTTGCKVCLIYVGRQQYA
jgi:hypothetical protein